MLLSLFLIIVKTLCASHVLVHDYFIMNVNIRKNITLRFMCLKNEENVNIVYTILRHLRRRTSHWRPLQFFFFTPSLFIINIHFIHISDLSDVYHQERLKYYSTIDTVNSKNDSCIKERQNKLIVSYTNYQFTILVCCVEYYMYIR